MTAIPVWVTPAGSLGVIAEDVFYREPIEAITVDLSPVYYRVIAGTLPAGIQLTNNGIIAGVPTTGIVDVQGIPTQVNADTTSTFTVRAFTVKTVNGIEVVDTLADRTFSITVSGPDTPSFVTPAGSIGTYYDSDEVDFQFQYINPDPNETVTVSLISGSLPGGLVLDPNGYLHGYIQPAPFVGATPGYDNTGIYTEPYDFVAASPSINYQFTLQLWDGTPGGIDYRTFSMFVYSRDTLTADNTQNTADNTFITADETNNRIPFLINSNPSDLGIVTGGSYFAYQFLGESYSTVDIRYSLSVDQGVGLPVGLTLDPVSGWLYGSLPTQSDNEKITYSFNITVYELGAPTYASRPYPFTLTVTGVTNSTVNWISPANLGSIVNGETSTLYVEAAAVSGDSLVYILDSGSFNQLPQGLTLLPSGEIAGRVSFDTFALDNGTTTFDTSLDITRNLGSVGTTFDSVYTFTVLTYAPAATQILYSVDKVIINNGGSGYSQITTPEIEFGLPQSGMDSVQATAGNVVITGGVITAVDISNAGAGYIGNTTVTITNQHGGAGGALSAQMKVNGFSSSISSTKTFSIKVVRENNSPYQNLYCVAMPPANDRVTIDALLSNTGIFVPDYIYRSDDPNFGVADRVTYAHCFGLAPELYATYVEALYKNHYWKNLVLGPIQIARAVDSSGTVIYEAVYSQIIDDLVNAQGQSVSKELILPYSIPDPANPANQISVVYPNSLVDMRTQMIDVVGQISKTLPLWMTSTQANGTVLGFTPAWVLCYAKPGRGDEIAYYISTKFTGNLNTIDFKVDRYVLDRLLSVNWDTATQTWTPAPSITTFDINPHYTSVLSSSIGSGYEIGDELIIPGSLIGGVDDYNDITITVAQIGVGGSISAFFSDGIAPVTIIGNEYLGVPATTVTGIGNGADFDVTAEATSVATTFDVNSLLFTEPVDMYDPTDQYDKYLVFPKANILE